MDRLDAGRHATCSGLPMKHGGKCNANHDEKTIFSLAVEEVLGKEVQTRGTALPVRSGMLPARVRAFALRVFRLFERRTETRKIIPAKAGIRMLMDGSNDAGSRRSSGRQATSQIADTSALGANRFPEAG
ncbi:MAG TPA: hypothetical protein VEC35_25235 [Noviherbaspirillum sp.]|nr:hypothetical protein [Noviherbaspirillum sp.]